VSRRAHGRDLDVAPVAADRHGDLATLEEVEAVRVGALGDDDLALPVLALLERADEAGDADAVEVAEERDASEESLRI
jgi:hypothetical protein